MERSTLRSGRSTTTTLIDKKWKTIEQAVGAVVKPTGRFLRLMGSQPEATALIDGSLKDIQMKHRNKQMLLIRDIFFDL